MRKRIVPADRSIIDGPVANGRSSGGSRPLDGILVVALEHAVAAPFATRQLADLGARVIKIERPGAGDFARSYERSGPRPGVALRLGCNRSKESLTLDLKRPEGLAILQALVAKADVVVQRTLRRVQRQGWDSPRLSCGRVMHASSCATSRAMAPTDRIGDSEGVPNILIQSEAAFLSVTGTPDVPSKAGISIADIAAGMYAYSSVLSALFMRERTGKGSHIDVSMLEALTEWMGFPLYYTYDGAPPPRRTGASHANVFPLHGPFVAGDGTTVMFGLQNEREWAILLRTRSRST